MRWDAKTSPFCKTLSPGYMLCFTPTTDLIRTHTATEDALTMFLLVTAHTANMLQAPPRMLLARFPMPQAPCSSSCLVLSSFLVRRLSSQPCVWQSQRLRGLSKRIALTLAGAVKKQQSTAYLHASDKQACALACTRMVERSLPLQSPLHRRGLSKA